LTQSALSTFCLGKKKKKKILGLVFLDVIHFDTHCSFICWSFGCSGGDLPHVILDNVLDNRPFSKQLFGYLITSLGMVFIESAMVDMASPNCLLLCCSSPAATVLLAGKLF
jgi:hypothetical protein